MPDNRVNIHYTVQEVTSAQRLRLARSGQLKIILFFWIGSIVFFGLHVLFPQSIRIMDGITWTVVWQVTLAYLATLASLIFILPWISFHLTRFWKLPLIFQFGKKEMRLSVSGKRGGLGLTWDQVQRVDENRLVFMVYYDSGQKHFILPKASFSEANEARFRSALAASRGPAPAVADQLQDAEEIEEEETA